SGVWTVVARVEQAAENWAKAHGLEIRSASYSAPNGTRLAEAYKSEAGGGEVAEGVQRLDARAYVVDFRNRKRGVPAVRGLPDINKTALVTVDQRPQQYAAQQGEHCGVRADSQREGQNYRHRQAFGATQGTRSQLQIADEVHNALNHGQSLLSLFKASRSPQLYSCKQRGSAEPKVRPCSLSEPARPEPDGQRGQDKLSR